MGARNKYTVAQIEAELLLTNGAISLAAENLGASYNTVKKYVNESPRLQDLIATKRERRVDKAELKLDEAIERGEAWAIALTLKTQGKGRGWVERQEIANATDDNGQPIPFRMVDYRAGLTDAQE